MNRWNCSLALALSIGLIVIAHAGKPDKPKPGDETGPTYSLVTLADEATGVFYDVTWGSDINASNVVVGRASFYGTEDHAVFWSPEGNLTLLKGEADLARGLNDGSEIVGVSGQDAVYWSSTEAEPVVLPTLDGYEWHFAADISDSGVICGEAMILVDDTPISRPIVWRVLAESKIAGPFELPMPSDSNTRASAVAVNRETDGVSLVVGEAYSYSDDVGYTAVAWAITFVIDPDSNELTVEAIPTTLDVGNHARASAVNDSNEIVGRAISGAPMYWSGTTSHTLKGLSPDNSRGWAWGINNHGVVVGESWHYEYKGNQISWEGQVAAVWPTPESDPILLVPIKGSVWGGKVFNEARAINDAGVILINQASRATLAYPQ